MIPSAVEQVAFLARLQRFLHEGEFTATYKYALLLSLADIAVRRGDDTGAPLEIPTREIAERFLFYYWRQARPYASQDPLWQITGPKPPKIITLVRQAIADLGDSLPRARTAGPAWDRLRGEAGHVDHFIAWSVYPVDLGHNFVLAHGACNAAKGDRLAGAGHLAAWAARNLAEGARLGERFTRAASCTTGRLLPGRAVGLRQGPRRGRAGLGRGADPGAPGRRLGGRLGRRGRGPGGGRRWRGRGAAFTNLVVRLSGRGAREVPEHR